MPIHLRAEPGEYAEGCLLPGDPLRAKYIAETFLDDPVEVNAERGMLGYTGTFRGKRVSVQSSGMGCPSAGIVIEELSQLGVKKILRVGTCGGLQPDLQIGDLIVALSATPADATPLHLIGGEPHAPTADWELVHAAVHHAKELGKPVRVGADRLQRRLLQPGRRPVPALERPRHPRGRDGGGDAVHARGAQEDPDGLPADRQRRGRRRRVQAHHATRRCARRSTR